MVVATAYLRISLNEKETYVLVPMAFHCPGCPIAPYPFPEWVRSTVS